jgi:hypothetical protein
MFLREVEVSGGLTCVTIFVHKVPRLNHKKIKNICSLKKFIILIIFYLFNFNLFLIILMFLVLIYVRG